MYNISSDDFRHKMSTSKIEEKNYKRKRHFPFFKYQASLCLSWLKLDLKPKFNEAGKFCGWGKRGQTNAHVLFFISTCIVGSKSIDPWPFGPEQGLALF